MPMPNLTENSRTNADNHSQYVHMSWGAHRKNMLDTFEHLLQTETFTDVTLACEGFVIKCHKIILAACSAYFEFLFLETGGHTPIIVLKDATYKQLRAILEYIYSGAMKVPYDDLPAVMRLAEALQVKGLCERDRNDLEREVRSDEGSDAVGSPNSSPVNNNAAPSPARSPYGNHYLANNAHAVENNPWLFHAAFMNQYRNFQGMHEAHTITVPGPNSPALNPVTVVRPTSPSPSSTTSHQPKRNDTPILRTALGHGQCEGSLDLSSHGPARASLMSRSSSNGVLGPEAEYPVPTQSQGQGLLRTVTPGEKKASTSRIANYVPNQKPEWKRYKQYTQGDIQMAIDFVRRGWSPLQAAGRFGVPSRTLYDKVKKLGIKTSRNSRRLGSRHNQPLQDNGLRGHHVVEDLSVEVDPRLAANIDVDEDGHVPPGSSPEGDVGNNGTGEALRLVVHSRREEQAAAAVSPPAVINNPSPGPTYSQPYSPNSLPHGSGHVVESSDAQQHYAGGNGETEDDRNDELPAGLVPKTEARDDDE